MKKLLFALCCFSLLFQSCKDDDDQNEPIQSTDFLIFGSFYGFCQGEQCIEIYELNADQLLEDVLDNYPNQDEFNEMDFSIDISDKRNLVEELLDQIPEELLTITDRVVGSPDAGDWGGVYVEVNRDGQHDFWLLDNADGGLPNEALITFKNRINAAVELINE